MFLFPQWFPYWAFFTLPIQTYASECPQPAKNQLFPFCLFLLLPTSTMLEWELGWPLCWWQMKEKQTQLACLQLQWFSRAGSSKDMLFVDKTHCTKLWGVSQCNRLLAPLEIPASCAGLAWRSHNGAQLLLGQVRRALSAWGSTGQITTCHLQPWRVYVCTFRLSQSSLCVHIHLYTYINVHTHIQVCVSMYVHGSAMQGVPRCAGQLTGALWVLIPPSPVLYMVISSILFNLLPFVSLPCWGWEVFIQGLSFHVCVPSMGGLIQG